MNRILAIALLAGLFTASVTAGGLGRVGGIGRAGGPADQAQAAAPTGTGLIAGRVVDVPSGKPVPEAEVILSVRGAVAPPAGGRGATPLSARVRADAQGRFFFAGLPAGSFILTAQHRSYLSAPVPGTTNVDLGEGERILDASLRMSKFASIGGTVRDLNGDPVVGMVVRAFRRTIRGARVALQPVFAVAQGSLNTTDRTDDRGVYRLSPLPPGEYVLCACTRDPIPFDDTLLRTLGSQPAHLLAVGIRALAGGADTVALDGTLKTYAPTLYPAAASLDRAETIGLASGEDREGVDIRVPLVRAARISGRIVGASSPVTAASIRLVAEGNGREELFAIPPMLVQPDGRFDFASVPPGQYRLIVSHRDTAGSGGARGAGAPSGEALRFLGGSAAIPPQPGTRGTGAPSVQMPLWADESITVADRDIADWSVTLHPGTRVSGRIVFDGTPPAERPATQQQTLIALAHVDGRYTRPASQVNPDLSFATVTPPGRYGVQVLFPPAGYRIRSVVHEGRDMTNLPLDLGTREISDLVVTLSNQALAELTVGVAAIGTERVPDGMVLVFPADPKFWDEPAAAAAAAFQAVSLTPKRTATVRNLPPGEYLAAFDPGFDPHVWLSRARLESLAKRATRVTLGPGARESIEVRR